MKKKIAVIAPTSTVARNYIAHLGERYDVITVGRRDSDILFDLLKDKKMILPPGLDAVINFAGMLCADTAEEVCGMIGTNVAGMIKICEAAEQSGAGRIIQVSSISASLPESAFYYGYYSLTKKQGEEMAALCCRNMDIGLCIIRPSQIFGPDPTYGKAQPLLYLMIRQALENKPVTIYGSRDAKRNYIYADNLFRIIDEAVERKAEGMINVISPDNISLSEAAETIVRASNSSSEIVFLDDKPDMGDNAFFSETDIFKKWDVPYTPFNDAVAGTVEHMGRKFI